MWESVPVHQEQNERKRVQSDPNGFQHIHNNGLSQKFPLWQRSAELDGQPLGSHWNTYKTETNLSEGSRSEV
jgi:hypothetical protein